MNLQSTTHYCCLFIWGKSLFAFLQELSSEGDVFTPSDVERALWSSAIGAKLQSSQSDTSTNKNTKRKRKR